MNTLEKYSREKTSVDLVHFAFIATLTWVGLPLAFCLAVGNDLNPFFALMVSHGLGTIVGIFLFNRATGLIKEAKPVKPNFQPLTPLPVTP